MTDEYNQAKDKKQSGLKYLESDSELPSKETAYRKGLRYLKDMGYMLIPSSTGVAAHHDVYELKEPQKLKGLNIPEEFQSWQKISYGTRYVLFLEVVENYVNEDFEARKLWAPLFNPGNVKQTSLYQIGSLKLRAKLQDDSYKPLELLIDTDPQNEHPPIAFIPRKEWFSKTLHNVKVSDIVTILPPTELELLTLIIGRLVVGRNNSVTASGNLIKHTARMAAVLCGQAGLGKSSFFNSLWQALTWAGYSKATIKEINARFNMGDVVSADIIYKDDTSSEELSTLFKSSVAKTIITGNAKLRVEDKGANAYDIEPVGTLFLNANEWNPRTAFSIDPGMADRIKLLQTFNDYEIDEQPKPFNSPNLRPDKHIPYLSEHLKVSPITLMLWLARLCADKFLEVIESSKETNALRDNVRRLTNNLSINLFKNFTEQTIASMLFCSYLKGQFYSIESAIGRSNFEAEFLPWNNMVEALTSFKLTRSGAALEAFLKYHFNEHDSTNMLHPYLGYRDLNMYWVREAYRKFMDSGSQPMMYRCAAYFKELKSRTGIELTTDLVWFHKATYEAVSSIKYIKKLARQLNRFVEDYGIEVHLRRDSEGNDFLFNTVTVEQYDSTYNLYEKTIKDNAEYFNN